MRIVLAGRPTTGKTTIIRRLRTDCGISATESDEYMFAPERPVIYSEQEWNDVIRARTMKIWQKSVALEEPTLATIWRKLNQRGTLAAITGEHTVVGVHSMESMEKRLTALDAHRLIINLDMVLLKRPTAELQELRHVDEDTACHWKADAARAFENAQLQGDIVLCGDADSNFSSVLFWATA